MSKLRTTALALIAGAAIAGSAEAALVSGQVDVDLTVDDGRADLTVFDQGGNLSSDPSGAAFGSLIAAFTASTFESGELAINDVAFGDFLSGTATRFSADFSDPGEDVLTFSLETLAGSSAAAFGNTLTARITGEFGRSFEEFAENGISTTGELVVTPLPAALPLFGTVVAGLAFWRRRALA